MTILWVEDNSVTLTPYLKYKLLKNSDTIMWKSLPLEELWEETLWSLGPVGIIQLIHSCL